MELASEAVMCKCSADFANIRYIGEKGLNVNGFREKSNIKSVVFENTGDVNIYEHCFNGCTGIMNLKLPEKLAELK